jgi:hypothetical protein
MTYDFTRGEQIVLVYDIETSGVTITGNENALCHLKKAGVTGHHIIGAPLALALAKTYNPPIGATPANLTFSGPSGDLSAGTYLFEGWIQLSGNWVSLGGATLRIKQNTADLPL